MQPKPATKPPKTTYKTNKTNQNDQKTSYTTGLRDISVDGRLILRDYHVNNHAWNFLAFIVFFALSLTRSQSVLSRWKQASRFIFPIQADVKSKLTINFRVAILTGDSYVDPIDLPFKQDIDCYLKCFKSED